MRRSLHLLASVSAVCGILAWAGVLTPEAEGQAPAPGQQPPAQAAAGQRGAPLPGTESGLASFQTRCSICHNNPAVEGAVSASTIREMPPERIYAALTTGPMQTQSQGLSDIEKRRIAEFMSGRPLESAKVGDAGNMPNRCPSNPTLSDPAQGPAWNGWGVDMANTRFQPALAAGLTAAQVPQLKLKWAFAYPAGESANGQPTIAAGRVFVGSDNGFVYSLDASTGCVYWSFENGSIVRNAVTVGPVTGQGDARYAVYFGDGHANVYAVDAQNGRLLWKTKVDPHFVARITAGIKFYNGRLFVPVSSSEEFRSGHIDYPCCTSRGSVVALDANTGKQIWKAWVVPDEPKPFMTQTNGVVLYKPAGGSVWSSPTVDPVRQAVYFGTGDATTPPAPPTTDAIMAVDINSGKLLWSYTADPNDVFMGGCGQEATRSAACPTPNGPDLDVGNSPILKILPNGRRVLLAGTKRGHVFALDPDNQGALMYRVLASTGAPVSTDAAARGGSIIWGGAADGENVYYGTGAGGLAALRLATGERLWGFMPPAPAEGARVTLGAAPTVIPGVVFEGASNGMLYAVSAADGNQLWEFNTAQAFNTVNKVTGRGGAITSSGAVIAGGRVFVGSGYAINSGASGGNVLLAFGID